MTDNTAPKKATRTRKAASVPTAKKAPAKRATKKGPVHPGTKWAEVLAAKGLSQTQAAKAMGVAPMTLNRLINGQGVPTAKVCVLFARATDQDVHTVWTEVANYELELAVAASAAKK